MDVVRMVCHRRRVPKIGAVRNQNALRVCLDAAQTRSLHLRATTLKVAQWRPLRWLDVSLANTVVVLMELPKPRDLIIRDARELRNPKKRSPWNSLRKYLRQLDAQNRLTDVVRIMLRRQPDRMRRDALHAPRNRLDAVQMEKHRLMVGIGKDAAWRRLTDAVQITSTQPEVQVWKAADVSIHRTDVVQITRRRLEDMTMWVAVANTLNLVVVQTRKLMPRDLTLPDVRATRSNSDVARMELPPPRDHITMDVIARTVSSSVARMDKHLPRDLTLRVAHVLPASMDVVRTESTKPKEANLKVANSFPNRHRRHAY